MRIVKDHKQSCSYSLSSYRYRSPVRNFKVKHAFNEILFAPVQQTIDGKAKAGSDQ